MTQHTLFVPFIQRYINRQEVYEITKLDYDKLHP